MERVLDTYRRAYSGLSREVWLLSIITLVHRSGTMVLPFLALYLTESFGMSPTDVGWMLALYGVGAILGSYGGGLLADRIGALQAQTLSFVSSGILLITLGQIGHPVAFGMVLVLASMAFESYRPANASAVAAVATDSTRFRAFALRRVAINLGMTVGPATGGLLATIDYGLLFWVNGGACLVASVLMVYVMAKGILRLPDLEPSADDGQSAATPDASKVDETRAPSPWRDGHFLRLIGLTTVQSVIFLQLLSSYPLTLHQNLGHPEHVIGLVFAFNTLLIVLAEMALIETVSKIPPLRVVAFGMVLMGLGFGLLPAGEGMVFLLFTVLLWTVGEMLTHPLLEGIAASLAPARARGAYMGLYTSTFSAALVLAPLLGNWAYEVLGWQILWPLNGCLALVVGLGFWALGRRERQI